MYRRPRRVYRRRAQSASGLKNYLLPFLVIILLGLMGVLVFNLGKALFGEKDVQAAYVHMEQGTVDMRTWGSDDFITLSDSTLVLQGDEILTSAGAQVVVEFFDGTIMRLDGGSNVVFEEFSSDDKGATVTVLLVDGKVWVNKVYKNTATTDLQIKTGNLLVKANDASIFEVENDIDEVVRGFDGDDVLVDVLDEEGRSALETVEVGIGQEAVFNDAALTAFRKFQSPNVVLPVDDSFRESSWFSWNKEEDENPTEFERPVNGQNFQKVEPEVIDNGEEDESEGKDESDADDAESTDGADDEKTNEDQEKDQEPSENEGPVSDDLSVPGIISVGGKTETNADGFYVVESNPALLYGVANGAADIVVNDYTLQKFNAGDQNWSYFANSDFELMREGENTYTIYAFDAEGNRSEPLIVKVLYQPKVEEEVPAEEGEVVEE